MSNITCVLDACSVINLIHIDEDDFIIKKLRNLDINLNEVVFNEVSKNVLKKIELSAKKKKISALEAKNIAKIISLQLTFYRSKNILNETIISDVGNKYFERIHDLFNYKKPNGEFYSCALSLYLSRIYTKKIYFYTDDLPAKMELSFPFNYQQIGQIKDTADLLVLLYWIDEDFTENQLSNFLSNLFSEYATDVKLLENDLKNYLQCFDYKLIKHNKDILSNLKKLIDQLSKLDFKEIGKHRNFFDTQKGVSKIINDILNNYPSVFELENKNSQNLLQKIISIRENLKVQKIQKWNDLLN